MALVLIGYISIALDFWIYSKISAKQYDGGRWIVAGYGKTSKSNPNTTNIVGITKVFRDKADA